MSFCIAIFILLLESLVSHVLLKLFSRVHSGEFTVLFNTET